MTSRERFLNSICGKPLDRFFRYEHGPWPSTRERWIREGYPPDADFASHFRMDPLVRIWINSGYTSSPYHPRLEERILEQSGDYVVYSDSDGIVKKMLKTQSDTSMPEFLRFPVATREDWRAMLRHLDPADADKRIGDPARWAQVSADLATPTLLPVCGAFGYPRNLFGDEGLSYVIYDDIGLLHEVLENWCDLYVSLIEKLTRSVRVDALLIWEDMCYKNGPLISPDCFRTFMLPRYRRFVEKARACGVQAVIVDSDGDVTQMIPLFLDGGADAIMPFEVQAGMDVVRIRRELGPSFCIMGGLDKRPLARDRKSIRAEVDRVVPAFLKTGRFIPTLDHTVPVDVPLANFEFYIECLRRYEN